MFDAQEFMSMRATHLKAHIRADGTLLLPTDRDWEPGPVEVIILQPDRTDESLLEFAGMLNAEEAGILCSAISEGCETIDLDGW